MKEKGIKTVFGFHGFKQKNAATENIENVPRPKQKKQASEFYLDLKKRKNEE
ncbi:MAG: hypothetical protein GX362_00255 [Methanosarcinaceae archaeon]|nr:hypothetical protein [Methanosarcinaceae archaeon]